MNPIFLVVIAASLIGVALGMLTLAGIADYIVTRNHHRQSQKGHDHDHL